MKAALTTTLLLAACSLHAAKDDKLAPIPKEKEGRWGIYSYTEAKEEAAKKKRPIAFLVQDERAEEASEKEAALRAYWGVAKDCTMVVVTSRLLGEAKARLGDAVYPALTSKDIGKTLPRMVVMNQTGDTFLGQMNTEQIMAADEKAMKAFSRQMEDLNKDPSKAPPAPAGAAAPAAPATPAAPAAPAAAAAPAPAAGPVTIKEPKAEGWTNAQGVAIQAAVLEITADKVVFQMANGSKVPYDIASLSDASKKRLEELKAANAK